MRRSAQRLTALELAARRRSRLGFRVFREDIERQGFYTESEDASARRYTQAELDALRAQGWELIVVRYVDWRAGDR